MINRRTSTMLAVAAYLTTAVPLSAQFPTDVLPPPQFHLSVQAIYGRPVGDFADHVKEGWGANFIGSVAVQPTSPLALHAEGGFLIYGSETNTVCFGGGVGCRVELDLTTTNSIFYGSLGPELMPSSGRVRPYVNASIGFAYFSTSSNVEGTDDEGSFAETTNFDDATFAWGSGGGLLIALREGRTPVYLDLGARYHANGKAEYLKEGDIQDNPDGSISFTPTRSETNLVTYRIGVKIGLRANQR